MNRFAFLFIAAALSAGQPEIINMGQTWEIIEPDMLTEIMEKIERNHDKIAAKLDKSIKREQEELENLSVKDPVELTPAKENKIYEIDVSYTVPENIYDGEGRVLYPAGYTFTPTDYVSLSYSLVVIDSSNREQVEWLKTEGLTNNIYVKILVCKGPIVPLIKELRQPVKVYSKEIHKRLKLTHTPTVITQLGNKLFAHEICLDCPAISIKGGRGSDKIKKTDQQDSKKSILKDKN